MFAAVDQHNPTVVIAIDHGAVDPVFNTMQTIVDAQAAAHLHIANDAAKRLLSIESVARWATSLAVGVGAVLILLFSRLRSKR